MDEDPRFKSRVEVTRRIKYRKKKDKDQLLGDLMFGDLL